MSLYNTTQTYGSMNKFLHWTVALLVLILLCVGATMGYIPEAYSSIVYNVHKFVGLSVLILMIFRFFWRLGNEVPQLPFTTPLWQKFIARLVHYLWYVVLIAMPLAGWIMSTAAGRAPSFFGLFTVPAPFVPHDKALAEFFSKMHLVLAYTILVLLVIHISAALKHYFIDKDYVLQRMLPNRFVIRK